MTMTTTTTSTTPAVEFDEQFDFLNAQEALARLADPETLRNTLMLLVAQGTEDELLIAVARLIGNMPDHDLGSFVVLQTLYGAAGDLAEQVMANSGLDTRAVTGEILNRVLSAGPLQDSFTLMQPLVDYAHAIPAGVSYLEVAHALSAPTHPVDLNVLDHIGALALAIAALLDHLVQTQLESGAAAGGTEDLDLIGQIPTMIAMRAHAEPDPDTEPAAWEAYVDRSARLGETTAHLVVDLWGTEEGCFVWEDLLNLAE